MKTYTIKDLKWEREGYGWIAHSIGGTFTIRHVSSKSWTCSINRFIGTTSCVCLGKLSECKTEASEWHRKAVESHLKENK